MKLFYVIRIRYDGHEEIAAVLNHRDDADDYAESEWIDERRLEKRDQLFVSWRIEEYDDEEVLA